MRLKVSQGGVCESVRVSVCLFGIYICACFHGCSRAVLCRPVCWRVIVFDSVLVPGFVLGCETLNMIR